jgi:hypothetical protein
VNSVTAIRKMRVAARHISQLRKFGITDNPKYFAGGVLLSQQPKAAAGRTHRSNLSKLEYAARAIGEAMDSSTAKNNVARNVQTMKNAARNKNN